MQPSTNGRSRAYTDQANQDWGHHEFVFGLVGHAGTWQQAQTDWQAYRLNDPLIAFQTTRHAGSLGKSFSLIQVSNPRIRLLALKKAEKSDEVILRMVELDGKGHEEVRVSFAGQIAAAREVDAQERPIGPATVQSGVLVTSFTAYQPRTFALRLAPPAEKLSPAHSQPVALQYDLATASNDDTSTPVGAGFDSKGNALPAEMLPQSVEYRGIQFRLPPAKTGTPNAVVARGQTISLPDGPYQYVYILAASAEGDQNATFYVGDRKVNLDLQDWGGFVGQWDTRIWKTQDQRDWAISANHAVWPPKDLMERELRPTTPRYPEDYVSLQPGYVKTADIAWYASHHHTPEGLNQPYQYSYLFAYQIPLRPGERNLKLPENDKIRVLAISVADGSPEVHPAQPLYDTLNRSGGEANAASAVTPERH
jgi:alpha-mannosidase